MTDLAPDNFHNVPSMFSPRRLANSVLAGAKLLCILVTVLATVWLVRLFILRHPLPIPWTMQVLFAFLVGLSCGLLLLRQRRHWSRPVRQLNQLLAEIQRGQAPIEALSTVTGGPALLIPRLQAILHDLKSQRTANARFQEEMRQRIANRTDALERVIGSLKLQATRDALTGLYNRRALDEYLPKIVDKIVADRGPLCLLMIDVDYFKLLNDTLGHQAGDELLRSIGQLIRSTIRDGDFAFRYGGDEFAIVLPYSDVRGGEILAQRLQSLVDALTKTLHVPQPPRLSIGISTLAELIIPTPENLISQADRSLYSIKAGRGR